MTTGFQVPECECGHKVGDHRSGGTNFPHPPVYGACLVPGCGCQWFRDRDDDDKRESA